jgi:acyl transferase domain-containing protein
VGDVALAAPHVRLVSNLTGQLANGELLQPAYWCKHARQPVRFADGLATLLHDGYRTFVEIGPHPVLSGMAPAVGGETALTTLPSLRNVPVSTGTPLATGCAVALLPAFVPGRDASIARS